MILNNLSMLFLPINIILIIIFTIIVYLIPRNTERNKLISNILLVLNFYLIIIFLMCFLEITINLEKIYFLNFRNDMEIDLETMLEFKINCIQFNSIDIRNEKILNLYKNFIKLINLGILLLLINFISIIILIRAVYKTPRDTNKNILRSNILLVLIFYLIIIFIMCFSGITLMDII